MRLRLAVAMWLLAVTSSDAFGEDPSPLDIVVLTCVGPGFIPDGDPFEILESLPAKNCVRACKAAAKGCKDVVKSIDKCGVGFLRASAKVAIEVCRGQGYSAQACRVINDEIKSDIAWWRSEGKIERDACDTDTQNLCLSRCQ